MALHHLLVRSVHVLGMALLVGGSVAAWAALRWTDADPRRVAAGHEWLFWTALGAMVATGVGNLGTLAPAVPGPASAWGATLTVKLLAVLGLLVGSAARVLAVEGGRGGRGGLRRAYAATVWYLVGLLALAEVLAHG